MGILKGIVDRFRRASSATSQPKLTEIGVPEPRCPHCGEILEKMPGRKITCKACGGAIHSRTRPIDGKKALFKPEELPLLEEQWAIRNGTLDSLLAERAELDTIRAQLRKEFSSEPSQNDVLWRLYNQRIGEYAKALQWGLYRNNQLHMAQLLINEGRSRDALHHLAVVLFFDVNGSRNAGTDKNGQPLQGPTEVWSLELALVAGGIVNLVHKALDGNGLTVADFRGIADEAIRPYQRGLGAPLSHQQSLEAIMSAIEE